MWLLAMTAVDVEWDKTFPKSDTIDHEKVSFYNSLGTVSMYDTGRARREGVGGMLVYIPFDKLASYFDEYLR